MKNFYSIAIIVLFLLSTIGCQSTPKSTIEDLKTAAAWEFSGHHRYLEYAEQALRDSFPQVAALFQATAETELIHVKKFNKILASLDINYTPVISPFSVGTTEENLKAAVQIENDELQIMYPEFVKNATKEHIKSALIAYNYASESEKGQREIYLTALEHLSSPDLLIENYYVCPECGNLFSSLIPEMCPMCAQPSDEFILKSASMYTLTELTTEQ